MPWRHASRRDTCSPGPPPPHGHPSDLLQAVRNVPRPRRTPGVPPGLVSLADPLAVGETDEPGPGAEGSRRMGRERAWRRGAAGEGAGSSRGQGGRFEREGCEGPGGGRGGHVTGRGPHGQSLGGRTAQGERGSSVLGGGRRVSPQPRAPARAGWAEAGTPSSTGHGRRTRMFRRLVRRPVRRAWGPGCPQGRGPSSCRGSGREGARERRSLRARLAPACGAEARAPEMGVQGKCCGHGQVWVPQ